MAVSICGNIFFGYLFFRLFFQLSHPKDEYQIRKGEIAPFLRPSSTIKPADAVELNEVDDELIKKSIKDRLSKGVSEPADTEEPDLLEQ